MELNDSLRLTYCSACEVMVKQCGQEPTSPPKQNSKTPSKPINEMCLSVFSSSVCLHSANTGTGLHMGACTRSHKCMSTHTHTHARAQRKPQWHIPVSVLAFRVTIIKPRARKKRRMTSKRHVESKSSIQKLFEFATFVFTYPHVSCPVSWTDGGHLIKMRYLPSLCFIVISVSPESDAVTETMLLGQAVWPRGWRWGVICLNYFQLECTITLSVKTAGDLYANGKMAHWLFSMSKSVYSGTEG